MSTSNADLPRAKVFTDVMLANVGTLSPQAMNVNLGVRTQI